jgi:hypothetical protein
MVIPGGETRRPVLIFHVEKPIAHQAIFIDEGTTRSLQSFFNSQHIQGHYHKLFGRG